MKSCSAYGPIAASVLCGFSPSATGTSSGEISWSRIARSTVLVSSSNCPVAITQRIRCWISVLGTPVFTA